MSKFTGELKVCGRKILEFEEIAEMMVMGKG